MAGSGLLIVVVLLGLMWLLLIRPQRRKQQQQQDLLSNLQVGDEIVTAGGIYGRIEDVQDGEILLEIAPNTTVRVARRAVATMVTEPEPEDEAEEEPEGADAQVEEAPEPARSAAEHPG